MKNLLRLFLLSVTQLVGCFSSSATDSWANQANDDINNIAIVGEKKIAVKTAKGLAWLAQETNKGKTSKYNCFIGYTIELINDIDLDNYKWTPIGTVDNPFQGSFNGAGYKISNIRIGSENAGLEKKAVGLFGYIKADQMHQEIKIENISLEGGEIYGGESTEYAGALVGYVYAYGYDVTVNIKISDCSSTVKVMGGRVFLTSTGGIIGSGEGKGEVSGSLSIENCINYGTVTGGHSSSSHTGGIIGDGKGTGEGSGTGDGSLVINNCTNNGTIKGMGTTSSCTGGIIGYGVGAGEGKGRLTVRNCKNSGDIKGGDSPSSSSTAGIIGYGYGYGDGSLGYGCLVIENCTNKGRITGGTFYSSTGGIVGEGFGDGYGQGIGYFSIQNCSNIGEIKGIGSSSSFTGGIIGYGYGIGDSVLETSDCYSFCKINTSTGFVGGVAGWLQCRSADTKVSITTSYASGIITGKADYKGGVVGSVIKTGNNFPTVTNCLVVMESLDENAGYAHRIIGGAGTTSNNALFTTNETSIENHFIRESANISYLGKNMNSKESWKTLNGETWNGEISVLQSKFNNSSWSIESSGKYLPRLNSKEGVEHPQVPVLFDQINL